MQVANCDFIRDTKTSKVEALNQSTKHPLSSTTVDIPLLQHSRTQHGTTFLETRSLFFCLLKADVRFTEMLRNQRSSSSALNREGAVTIQPLQHILALSLDNQRRTRTPSHRKYRQKTKVQVCKTGRRYHNEERRILRETGLEKTALLYKLTTHSPTQIYL